MGAKYVGFLSFQNWEIQFVHFCVETVLSENPGNILEVIMKILE